MNLIKLINETIADLTENPDNVLLPSGEKIHCEQSDAYPFIVDAKNLNNVFVGNAGQYHGSFEPDIRKMGYNIGYYGRIWLNSKIITFWNYPQEHELNKILKGLEDALRDEQNVNVNILNDPEFTIEVYDKYIDDDGNNVKDSKLVPLKQFKGEDYEAPKIDHLLNQAEKERLKKTGERIAHNTLYHNKRMAKGTKSDSAAEYKFAKERGIAENLNEDPDSLIINPNNDEYEKELRYYDSDALAFMYVDNVLFCGFGKSHGNVIRLALYDGKIVTPDHIKKQIDAIFKKNGGKQSYDYIKQMVLGTYADEIRDSDRTKYDGRLWMYGKTISFWKYPENKTVLFKMLSDIEKKMNIKIINNGYKIEVINLKKPKYDLIPIENYGKENHTDLDNKPHELSPLQWQQMGGKKPTPYNTIYHNSKKEKGTLSKSAAEYDFKTKMGVAENKNYRGQNIKNIILEEIQSLNEVVTDIVYHYTNTHNAYDIINTNEFNLSAAMGGGGAETSVNRNKFFFLSLTRSKSTGYKQGDVRLKLDGRKLSQTNKSIPIDYWQYSTNPKDWNSNTEYINRMKTGFEDEDRIVSNKSEIPNAKNYILEVSIRIDKNDNLSYSKRLYLICKQNNIPVFIYQNENDFNLDIKKNAVNPNELFKNIEDVENNYKPFRHFANALATLIAYNDDDNKQKIIDYLDDEKKINDFLEELEKRIYNNFRIGATYERDTLPYINAEIHNMRSSTHPDDKFLLKLLAYDMRKNKVKNTADYLKLKQWNNKKTNKQFNQEYKQFLLNIIDASIPNIIDDQFSKSLEVNQNEYYEHAYEYPLLINQLMNYVNQIKSYISNTIDSNDDILNYSYNLSRDEIINKLNLGQYSDVNNVKLNLNIEYYHHYSGEEAYENLEYDFKKAIEYILYEVNDKYYDKAKELLNKYQKQLYDSN